MKEAIELEDQDSFHPYRGGFVSLYINERRFIVVDASVVEGLTPEEARRLARSLNRLADKLEP